MKAEGKDKLDLTSAGANRLANRVNKGLTIDPNTGTAKQGNERAGFASPTSFLRGQASPRLNSFMSGPEEVDCI